MKGPDMKNVFKQIRLVDKSKCLISSRCNGYKYVFQSEDAYGVCSTIASLFSGHHAGTSRESGHVLWVLKGEEV